MLFKSFSETTGKTLRRLSSYPTFSSADVLRGKGFGAGALALNLSTYFSSSLRRYFLSSRLLYTNNSPFLLSWTVVPPSVLHMCFSTLVIRVTIGTSLTRTQQALRRARLKLGYTCRWVLFIFGSSRQFKSWFQKSSEASFILPTVGYPLIYSHRART
jgi:hypothetical protein